VTGVSPLAVCEGRTAAVHQNTAVGLVHYGCEFGAPRAPVQRI